MFIRSWWQKNLGLEVIPPYGIEIGKYKFTGEIESSVMLYHKMLSMDIRGIVGKRVDFDKYRVWITAGNVASFVVTVRNYGSGITLTNITPEVSASGWWRVDITPRTATSILPSERRVFNVDVIRVCGGWSVVYVQEVLEAMNWNRRCERLKIIN